MGSEGDRGDASGSARTRVLADPTLREAFTLRPTETIRSPTGDQAPPDPERKSRVVLGDVLGAGGMSVVYRGTQLSLARRVAVKTVAGPSGRMAFDLLREAWLTGSLEHPNIVPVHEIEHDDDGRPLVVLREIEGESWRTLMHDADALAARGVADALEWNLSILGQVATAVHFAHSRGVVHRDLKPDNVMIGAFGEVYVLDWGLAVSLVDDGSGRLPLAKDVRHVSGTPGYMAPELLDGHGERLGPRTDVYLLGAILYEILCGSPPHGSGTVEHMLRAMLDGVPALPPSAPPEACRIARQALATEPAERHASAEELRQSLADFLRQRGALRLVEAADRSTAALEADAATAQDAEEAWGRAVRLHAEARFGYRQALEAWPDAALAQAGLSRATRAIVELALRTRSPEAAAALLSESESAPEDLRQRVLQAQEQRRRQEEQMARTVRDHDPGVGRPVRAIVALSLGLAFAAVSGGMHVLVVVEHRPRGHLAGVLTLCGVAAFGFLVRRLVRRRMTGTRLNRRIFAVALGTMVAGAVLRMCAWALGLTPEVAETLTVFVWAAGVTTVAGLFEPKLAPSAVVYGLALLAAVRWPATRFAGQAMAHLFIAINGWLVWGRPTDPASPRRDDGEVLG